MTLIWQWIALCCVIFTVGVGATLFVLWRLRVTRARREREAAELRYAIRAARGTLTADLIDFRTRDYVRQAELKRQGEPERERRRTFLYDMHGNPTPIRAAWLDLPDSETPEIR